MPNTYIGSTEYIDSSSLNPFQLLQDQTILIPITTDPLTLQTTIGVSLGF